MIIVDNFKGNFWIRKGYRDPPLYDHGFTFRYIIKNINLLCYKYEFTNNKVYIRFAGGKGHTYKTEIYCAPGYALDRGWFMGLVQKIENLLPATSIKMSTLGDLMCDEKEAALRGFINVEEWIVFGEGADAA